ncbi:hypothetical protein [Endozoicomonas sp. 8E]|uniref:hypothetical protein n=1 Tax=Endozoicomonas sp. 8E TaxID=3035692 RepID=UPI002938E9BB|nr:hypothetical protein [Endozoicomonas sp. 8E]WOG30268.1 hypothetical protein P6910_11685 [Endozoicomonas sp. 8E]
MLFGDSLHAVELVGSSPLPAHFLYSHKLVEPEQPDPLRGCHELTPVIPGFILVIPGFILVIPAKAGIHTGSPPEPYCPVPPWPCHPREGRDPPLALDSRLRGNDDLRAWERAVGVLRQPPERGNELLEFYVPPEVLEKTSNALIARGAAGGDDDDQPPDGNSGSPEPEPQPDLTLIPDPVQTCLQQKKQLLVILQIKRLWAIMTGQTTLARILSDRIMVIEADLLDLERSDTGTIQPGLVQTWLAENGQELRVYREMVSGKYSGRQVGNGKKNQSSRMTKASTTATTGQTTRGSAARNKGTGSTGANGRGGDDPLSPLAEQDTGNSIVTCSKCDKVLNPQELERIANQTTASALLCNKCLSGIQGNKRVKRIREEAEPDSSEPAQKKKKGPARKRKDSTAVAEPAAKKKKPPDTQIPDDLLEKIKANIKYELSQEELQKVQTLVAVFKKNNIAVKNTFYKLPGCVDRKSFNGFFDNAAAFFGHLSENFKNTGMLTGMLGNKKIHIRSFAERSLSELEYLASLDLLNSFSSMSNSRGVPTHEQVKAILGWPEWKDRDGEFNTKLFRSFSSMNNGKGMLKHEQVKEVLGWPEWKDKDGEFNMELFRSFSSMNHGKGMLKHEQVKEVLAWSEWKDKDGEFNMELFRSFSSMNSSKGMLKHEQVKEVLGWKEWKDKHGEFNMELFRAFSSMNHGKGMLKHEQVKELLGWLEWKDKDGEFNIELFRSFSSMSHGKGVLQHEQVKLVLGWPEWKDKDGEFSMKLFRSFSSMNSSKGMLKQEEVKEVLSWPEWKDKDGEFNMELFRSFSSMNHRKGMLKHEQVKEVLGWPEWKDKDGEFNMELFRSFSSMNSGKGMLKHEQVKEVLGWPEWKDKDGEFSMELFRSFSSINNGKGTLKHEQVKEVLSWPEWKDKDGEFSMELFRSFSSMNNGKGVLKKKEAKEVLGWPEWKDKDGEFSMELFRSFSSMNNGKGVLKKKEVKEVLGWPEWKGKDGELNMELFRSFSSMNNSKGVPTHEQVKEVLNWPEWKHKGGELNIKLFRIFASMNHSQGLPKHEPVKKVLDWIGCRGAPNHRLLQIMLRLWVSAGLPAIKMLQHWETQLKQLLLTELTGELSSPDNEGDDKYNRQIKTVALYLSTPKPEWSLRWTVLEQFCQLHKEAETLLMLESLIGFLSSSGGKSVKRYLQANQPDRHFLWRHSMKAVPLHVLNRAMLLCSCDEDRERFVYFAKRLKSLPDKRLWEQYSALLQPLSAVLKLDFMQRLYLEILQPLTKDDQLCFLDASHARAVFDLFPSLSALQKLSKEHSSHWLNKLLEACLQLKNHDITKEGIQILFEALLKTHSLLPWDNDIPGHFLSGMQTTDNNHVEIPVSGLIQSGEQLALSYIAVLMQNLNEMSFTVKGQWLEVEMPADGVQNYRFPMPQLEIQDEKMAISNWSEEQFRTVLKITGISEHYYLTADQWQKLDNVQSRQAEARQPENELEPQKQAFGSLWLKLNQTEIFGSEILNLLDEYESEMELMHTVTLLKKAKIDSATHILEEWRQRACRKIEQLKKQDPLLSDVDPDVYQGCQELELLDGCGSIF